MKKNIITFCISIFMCFAGFAENKESAMGKYKYTIGGFWTCYQDFAGGYGEYGFNLLSEENKVVVRDCIYIEGQGGYLAKNDSLGYGALEIGNKFILGGKIKCNDFIIRSYGFSAVGVGLYTCEGHIFFSLPIIIDLSLGGGFEFQFASKMAFVIEFGGLFRMFAGENNYEKKIYPSYSTSPSLSIGFRSYI